MADYQISYVLATHNQLAALRPAIDRLATARQPTEEIVVIDGGSTDGSADYLRQLQEASPLAHPSMQNGGRSRGAGQRRRGLTLVEVGAS